MYLTKKIKKFTKSSENIPPDAIFLYAREEVTYSHNEEHLKDLDKKEVVFYFLVNEKLHGD